MSASTSTSPRYPGRRGQAALPIAAPVNGRYESIDSGHFIQAERPQLVGVRIEQLLRANT